MLFKGKRLLVAGIWNGYSGRVDIELYPKDQIGFTYIRTHSKSYHFGSDSILKVIPIKR
jgi:hypothetical protein